MDPCLLTVGRSGSSQRGPSSARLRLAKVHDTFISKKEHEKPKGQANALERKAGKARQARR